MTANKTELDKKFPLWGSWMGAGIAAAAILLLLTTHIASRGLILVGAITAVVVAAMRWKITPAAQRTAWLLIPAILGPALLGIFLYLRYDYLPKALEADYQQETTQQDDMFGNQYDDLGDDGSHDQFRVPQPENE